MKALTTTDVIKAVLNHVLPQSCVISQRKRINMVKVKNASLVDAKNAASALSLEIEDGSERGDFWFHGSKEATLLYYSETTRTIRVS